MSARRTSGAAGVLAAAPRLNLALILTISCELTWHDGLAGVSFARRGGESLKQAPDLMTAAQLPHISL